LLKLEIKKGTSVSARTTNMIIAIRMAFLGRVGLFGVLLSFGVTESIYLV